MSLVQRFLSARSIVRHKIRSQVVHRNIKGFDGIRALAVISVVLTHLGVFNVLTENHFLSPALIPMIHGGTGVQAFFVLSGFLITTLLVNEFNTTGTISIKNFILRRVLRIFPLYILFLIFATLLHILGRNVTSWESLTYAYLYCYNFVPKEFYTSFMGHTWSLAVEEHFYFVWPIVFLLLFGKYSHSLLGLVLTFIISAPIIHLLLLKTGVSTRYFVERWSFIAGFGIAMGCCAALLIADKQLKSRTRILAEHPATLLIGAVLYANSLFIYSDSWFLQNIGTGFLRTIGITLAIIWIYFNQTSFLIKLLELRFLKYIGLISYGVYMYQGLLLATGPARDPGTVWPPQAEIGFLLLIIAAPLSYHYFEKPFLRLKDRNFSAKSVVAGQIIKASTHA